MRSQYHDAYDPDAPQVRELYERGLVMQFPPCFRCGQLRCSNDQCNNVPDSRTGRQLREPLGPLAEDRGLVTDGLGSGGRCCPPSMGQASPQEPREADTPRRTEACPARTASPETRVGAFQGASAVRQVPGEHRRCRMANPCHIMTPAFASELLDRFGRVDQTSDMFLHQAAPHVGEALTIFPPIASDLSWSEGSVESYIHPKEVSARYLSRHGQGDAAAEVERQIQRHRKHIFARDILCVGHPRSGSGLHRGSVRTARSSRSGTRMKAEMASAHGCSQSMRKTVHGQPLRSLSRGRGCIGGG